MVQIINNLLQKIEGRVEAAAFNSKEQMKGLTQFITDIRLCKSREAEIKRVNKELANIRNKFRTDKNIDGYHRKKYIAKLILIFLLGYEINIGHNEAAFLLASNKLSEKQIGYVFLSLLPPNFDSDLNHIVTNSLTCDLYSNKFYNLMLTANFLPFYCDSDLIREMSPILNKQLLSVTPTNSEYQLYLMCYLTVIQIEKEYMTKHPEIFNKIAKMYPAASDLMLTTITDILYEGALVNPNSVSFLIPSVIQHLFKLSTISANSPMSYYNIVSPWTIIKSLQLLQLLPLSNNSVSPLSKILTHIFSLQNPHAGVKSSSRRSHYANILNSIKFEAVGVVACKMVNEDCLLQTNNFLATMLASNETNFRFLFLEYLIKMKHTPIFQVMTKDFSHKLSDLIASEKNSGLRLQAVSVIYSVGDLSNSKQIVDNMIKFLMGAEWSIRDQLSIKICSIASKNISDAKWYIDSMINVLLHGRELAAEEVWFKVAQTISQHKSVQEYSVKTLINFLNHQNSCENIAKLGVYLIGEYGHLVCEQPQFNSRSQYSLVIGMFPFCTTTTKNIILTALVKMAHNQPTLFQQIASFFDNDIVTRNINTEVQQRACEYRQLLLSKDENVLSAVLGEMPIFELTESSNESDDAFESVETTNPTEYIISSATDLLSDNENLKVAQSVDSLNILPSITEEPFPFQTENALAVSYQGQILNASFLDKFLTTNSGVLYETQAMTIKMASIYNQSTGSHEIILESTDPYIHLKVVNYEISESTKVLFSTFSADRTRIFSGGCSISFQSVSDAPLSSGVTITIHLLTSNDLHNTKKFTLMLPISVTNYMAPFTIDMSLFATVWSSMASPELESIEVFECSRIAESAYITEKFKSLNMEILVGIDPNPKNFVAASAFYCQSSVAGCIARLETKPNTATMRLTVRSKMSDLTSAISKKIISIL